MVSLGPIAKMRLQGMAVLDSEALPIAARGAYQRKHNISQTRAHFKRPDRLRLRV
jgi:hypothetical protein